MTMKIIRHGDHRGKAPSHPKAHAAGSRPHAAKSAAVGAGAHKAVARLTAEVRHEHPLHDWGSKPGGRR